MNLVQKTKMVTVSIVRFGLLLGIKLFARMFYRFEVQWVRVPSEPWVDVRLFVLLNHTSLFEPLFLGVMPLKYLWMLAVKGTYPGAEKTLMRPIAGRFFRSLTADTIAISRKRDHTWDTFLGTIRPDSIVIMFPEGRMKRRTGLDMFGRPLRVRSGIADVLAHMTSGHMMLGYSQGLHHVQAPGEGFPKLFKTIAIRIEQMPIATYKEALCVTTGREFNKAVMSDLEERRDAQIQKVV